MQLILNIDDRGYKKKPTGQEQFISNRTRNEGGIAVLEDPQELLALIQEGKTFTPAQIGGTLEQQQEKDEKGHNIHPLKEFWISQQVLVADIDNGEKVKGKLVPNERVLTPAQAIDACRARGIEPFAVYKTFSYTDACPRFRVVIVLETPITKYEEAEDFINRFRFVFNEQTQEIKEEAEKFIYDNVCTDSKINPVSMIYGSTAGCILYKSDSITPLEVLRALPQEPVLPSKTQPKSKASKSTSASAGAQTGALQSLKEQLNADINDFDLERYIEISTDSRRGATGHYNPCPICGHNKCLTLDKNSYHCFSEHHPLTDKGKRSGNIITYLMQKHNLDRGQALEFFKFDIMQYDREVWNEAWRQEQMQMQGGKYSFADTIGANNEIIRAIEQEQADLLEQDAQGDNAPAAAPGVPATDPPQIQAAAPKAQASAQSLFVNATEYLHNGRYDYDIAYMQKFAGRHMGLHAIIDKHLTLYPGLAVLGGQASLGKTTFAVNMVHKLLARGEHVIYFAFEQTRAEIFTKSIARQVFVNNEKSQITNIDIKNGNNGKQVEKARQQLEGAGLFYNIIECDFNWKVADIKNAIGQYMQLYPNIKPVVIIDYLQLIAPPAGFRGGIREYTDENLKELKSYQKDNGLFIMLISSFNRSSYLDPVSYDSFKETGMIESTCDYVWGLQLSVLDPANIGFYFKLGVRGGLSDRTKAEKLQQVQQAQAEMPKKVQFVSLKSRAGKQSYTANFLYYPAHDYFAPTMQAVRTETEEAAEDPAQEDVPVIVV